MLAKTLLLTAAVLLASTGGPLLAADPPPAPNPVTINAAEEITAAALAQIRSQERLILQQRGVNELQRQQITELSARAAAAEAAAAWLPWVLLLALAATVVAAWLAVRPWSRPGARHAAGGPMAVDSRHHGQADLQHDVGAGDRFPAAAALSASGYLNAGEPTVAGLAPMVMPSSPHARAPQAGAEPAAARAALASAPQPVPRMPASELSLATGVPPRPVSVEELMDLEQQVDFFVVLGQDEAAIDLLVGHIRATGGTSPLPYLKLLEIYAQRGDEAGYERIQSRFNQRFSALAPPWGGDLNEGRVLEDYAEVVERLQVLWPMSRDALAEIDALMHPQAELPVFDLPAFRDLLMLHGVAGDLLARAVPAPAARHEAPAVDLLLPLDDGRASDVTTPHSWLASRPVATPLLMPRPSANLLSADDSERGGLAGAAPAMVAATPVDVDLGNHAPAPREFTRPAEFNDVDLFRDSRRSDFAALDHPIDPTPSRRLP